MTTVDQSRAIRYLLGKLPEQEAEALAEEMFTSDETFSVLEDAENALVEAYLDGALSAEDSDRLEALFRSSSHMNDRVELERGLRALRAARPPARRALPWLPWAAAVVFGLTGGGLALQANRDAARARTEGAERERALSARVAEQDERLRLLEESLADRPAPAIETWPLAGGTERATGGGAAFTVASGWVRLRTPDRDGTPSASYRARLTTPEGRDLFRSDGLAAVSEAGGPFVDVIVPAGLLPRGTYILSVTRVAASGSQELRPYAFSVRPR